MNSGLPSDYLSCSWKASILFQYSRTFSSSAGKQGLSVTIGTEMVHRLFNDIEIAVGIVLRQSCLLLMSRSWQKLCFSELMHDLLRVIKIVKSCTSPFVSIDFFPYAFTAKVAHSSTVVAKITYP